MNAREQMSKMLNELMGPSRNNDVDRSALNFRDKEVCKFFLVKGFWQCNYYHDENLKLVYQQSEHFERLGYEKTFYRFLCKMHDEITRKISKNKERLALTQGNVSAAEESAKVKVTEKITGLEAEIASNLQEAERCGEMGQLERSQKFVKKAEELRVEIENAKRSLLPDLSKLNDPNAPKPMEVCENRRALHGQTTPGYAKITATMLELKERLKVIDDVEERGYDRSPDRHHRKRSESHDRDRHSSHRHRSRDDDSSRKHRSSKRSRSRSRDRRRSLRDVNKINCRPSSSNPTIIYLSLLHENCWFTTPLSG
uniref:Luc7-like protein 3 n=1 Tax=Ditylenchus dipsaci TaxID=166011 RepID=A0A915E5Q4_9BILA